MKIQNLGMDDLQSPKQGETVMIELDEKEMYTPQDELEDVTKKVEEIEKTINTMQTEDSVARTSTSLSILEKEKALQADKEREWLKEKKRKKRARFFKTAVLVAIAAILLLALLGGYRIPVPDEWVAHMQGIWETAVSYFTGETGLSSLFN